MAVGDIVLLIICFLISLSFEISFLRNNRHSGSVFSGRCPAVTLSSPLRSVYQISLCLVLTKSLGMAFIYLFIYLLFLFVCLLAKLLLCPHAIMWTSDCSISKHDIMNAEINITNNHNSRCHVHLSPSVPQTK